MLHLKPSHIPIHPSAPANLSPYTPCIAPLPPACPLHPLHAACPLPSVPKIRPSPSVPTLMVFYNTCLLSFTPHAFSWPPLYTSYTPCSLPYPCQPRNTPCLPFPFHPTSALGSRDYPNTFCFAHVSPRPTYPVWTHFVQFVHSQVRSHTPHPAVLTQSNPTSSLLSFFLSSSFSLYTPVPFMSPAFPYIPADFNPSTEARKRAEC